MGEHRSKNALDGYMATATFSNHLNVPPLESDSKFSDSAYLDSLDNRLNSAGIPLGTRNPFGGQHYGGGGGFDNKAPGDEDSLGSSKADVLHKKDMLGTLPDIPDLRSHKFDANKQFFNRLQKKPDLPTRIEARDVQSGFEDMEMIRDKFTKVSIHLLLNLEM
jgi:hypothetical protein